MQRGLVVNMTKRTDSQNTDMECTRAHLSTNVRLELPAEYMKKTAYEAGLEVPAPAVIHEPDETSTEEIPHQDGEVRYQHVRHCQPHKLLQGGPGENKEWLDVNVSTSDSSWQSGEMEKGP